MRYADPLRLKCNCCGVEGLYPLDLVRALEAVCKGCGGRLKNEGESINSSILSFELSRRLGELVLAIEEAFVFDASQVEYSSLSTVGDILALLEVSFPELTKSEIERKLSVVLDNMKYDGKIVHDSSFSLSDLSLRRVH